VRVLGICDSQDAGAVCLISGSGKLSAVNEERLSRVKLQGGFPTRAIKEVLRLQGIAPESLDLVAAASRMTPSWMLRSFPSIHARLRGGNKQFSTLLALYMTYQVLARKSRVFDLAEALVSKAVLEKNLKIGG
jgi:Predicted carbamoyl transferase, NodU family